MFLVSLKKRRGLAAGFLLIMAQTSAYAQAQAPEPHPPKVTLINPNPPGHPNPFWSKVTDFMRAVAEDLDIEFKVVYSKGNTYSIKKDGLALVESLPQGNYLVTGYFSGSSSKYIQRANERGVNIFVINAGIADNERLIVGEPRGKLQHWIGHMAASDVQAGYELADVLINKAISLMEATTIHVVALSGGTNTVVPLRRLTGLEARIEQQFNVRLDNVMATMWTRKEANITAIELLEKNPEADVVWTVGDSMSLGVVDAIKAAGKKSGVDILTGGIDWSDGGIASVASGEMTASVGGHVFEGGWALLLIHDYHYGIDFAEDPGISSTTKMRAITADNAQNYLDKLNKPDWNKIDFKQFSKKYNPALQKYDFSLEALLDAFDNKN